MNPNGVITESRSSINQAAVAEPKANLAPPIAVVKTILKTIVTALALTAAFPLALLCAFGRIAVLFQLFSHSVALVPGILGDYLRVAFYCMTLTACSLHSRISFGTFFAQREVRIARSVYIGAYCVIGRCNIGERTQIATHVQIFGGGQQHKRDVVGRILGADEHDFMSITIGCDVWIGASAIVMADVGAGSTIGAASVVPKPIACHVVAVGNPARTISEIRL